MYIMQQSAGYKKTVYRIVNPSFCFVAETYLSSVVSFIKYRCKLDLATMSHSTQSKVNYTETLTRWINIQESSIALLLTMTYQGQEIYKT